MIRFTLPYQPSSSSIELSVAASTATCCRRRRSKFTIVCSIPARDRVIDFGKFKGCRMGTLPSHYLRWLSRESSASSRLSVWSDYAKQVLHDPYYQDRLEWETIEKLAVRGDLRRGTPPTSSAGVKGSMQALGWDLSDHSAWIQVDFSLLGTSYGGRIPRKKLDPFVSTPKSVVSKPRATISNPKHAISNHSLTAGTSATEGSLTDTSVGLSPPPPPPKNAARKSSLLNSAAEKQYPEAKPRLSQSLSLQEELLRRRQLRKERFIASILKTPLRTTENAGVVFPGRESFLKQVSQRADKRSTSQ